MPPLVDRAGLVYGRLTVVSRALQSKPGDVMWNCKCTCGARKVIRGPSLGSGQSRSCGCSTVKHGHTSGGSSTVEHITWTSMRARCTRSSHAGYARYGGRGISICSRWDSFPNFLSDMGPRPSAEHSIDRIDNDGNYEPSNCRWATRREQGSNRKGNVWLSSGGLTKTKAQWSRRLGGNKNLVNIRLSAGWTKEDALTTPVGYRKTNKWISLGGRKMTQTQWSLYLGGGKRLVGSRLKLGWTKEEAVTTPPGQRRTPTP